MRVLLSSTAGAGHFDPLVPFVRAFVDAGHDVVVTAPGSFASSVERAGFVLHPFADVPPEELRAVYETLPDVAAILGGAASHDEATAIVLREVFGRLGTRAALPGMEALVGKWRPDVIVRESWEFASYIVAEAQNIPHVQIAVGLASLEEFAIPLLEDPLTELGAERGLVGLRSAPRLTLVPELFEDPAVPGREGTWRFREVTRDGREVRLPEWWAGSSDPLVYVTFGTVAAGTGFFPDFYRAAIAALDDLPIRVLLTIGDAGDPEALGPVPAKVHVEKWWSQKEVMPHASALVIHGGFATTLLGLASGLPMVVVPLFADQPRNARRVEAIGAGIALGGGPAAIGALRDAVRRVLDQESYRTGAARVAEEIARLPPTSESVALLQELAG